MNEVKAKKLLTLSDLYNFYASQDKNLTFSSVETGYKLAVQVPAQFEINKEQNDNSLLFCLVKLMHSGENRNHSSVTDDALIKASKTLAYKPILANFVEYTDPETDEKLVDFTSHDMEITEDGMVYYEHQIGCFTSDAPYFEVEEDTGHNFLYGYCAIPREYTSAADIIERKNGTKVSVELEINEMQYSAVNKVLELTDVNILGATCLGKDPDTLENVEEGMKNARLDIADFSQANNSMMHYAEESDINKKLIETLEALNVTLSKFNIDDSQESDETDRKEEVAVETQEILVNEEVTEVEEVEEVVEETTEEETEETTKVESTEEVIETETEEVEDPVEDETPEVVETEFEEIVEEVIEEEVVEEETNEDDKFALIERTFDIDGNKFSVSFTLSHEDIRCGLYKLVEQYCELDNDWYDIRAVYDDSFVFQGWFTGKIYGQKYTKDEGAVAFDGERYELFEEFVTVSEKAELESMRSNYAALVQFKEDTENAKLHAERENILFDQKYSVLAEKDENDAYKNEAYAKLVSEMDNYSLDDLEKELKSVFADYITNGGQFAYTGEEVKPVVTKKLFAVPTSKKPSRYGNLFNK
mgnify:CR=1 FL=1